MKHIFGLCLHEIFERIEQNRTEQTKPNTTKPNHIYNCERFKIAEIDS